MRLNSFLTIVCNPYFLRFFWYLLTGRRSHKITNGYGYKKKWLEKNCNYCALLEKAEIIKKENILKKRKSYECEITFLSPDQIEFFFF